MPRLFLLMPMETLLINSSSLSYWTTTTQPSMQLLLITQRWYTKWKQFDTQEPDISHSCTTRRANTCVIIWGRWQNNSLRVREKSPCCAGLASNKDCNFHGASADLLGKNKSSSFIRDTCTAKPWMERRDHQASRIGGLSVNKEPLLEPLCLSRRHWGIVSIWMVIDAMLEGSRR